MDKFNRRMKQLICFGCGFVLCAFADHFYYNSGDYNARRPTRAFHKYPESMMIVVSHNPDLNNLKQVEGAGRCILVQYPDKASTVAFQNQLAEQLKWK